MSQEEANPPGTVSSADLRARFDQGMRDGAQKITPWQAARGFAGSFTLTFLVASAFFPLLPLLVGGASGGVVWKKVQNMQRELRVWRAYLRVAFARGLLD